MPAVGVFGWSMQHANGGGVAVELPSLSQRRVSNAFVKAVYIAVMNTVSCVETIALTLNMSLVSPGSIHGEISCCIFSCI